jgi:hypothetical protein
VLAPLATHDFASWSVEPSCSSFANPKIPIYFTLRAHIAQLSPHLQWRVAPSGGSTLSMVTSSGPTMLTFLLSHWHVVHTHVSTSIPSEIQRLDLSQIYGADPFGVSGFRASGVHASTPLELPFAEILKLLSTPPLDPTVKFLSYDLRCRSFQNFGFRYFATCENKVLPFWFPGCRNVIRQPRVPPDGWSRRIQGFAYRDFHVPVQLQRVFKPCARFPDLTVTRVLLFPEQILRLQHFWCGVLSPCGQIPHRLRFHNTATPPELGNMVK